MTTPKEVVWIFHIDDCETIYIYFKRPGGIEMLVSESLIEDINDASKECPQSLLEWYFQVTRMDIYAMGEYTKTIKWLRKKMFSKDSPNSEFTNVDIEKEMARNEEGFWPNDE